VKKTLVIGIVGRKRLPRSRKHPIVIKRRINKLIREFLRGSESRGVRDAVLVFRVSLWRKKPEIVKIVEELIEESSRWNLVETRASGSNNDFLRDIDVLLHVMRHGKDDMLLALVGSLGKPTSQLTSRCALF